MPVLCLQRFETSWSCGMGVCSMECVYQFLCVFHCGGGEPGIFRIGVPLPFYEILDASSTR